MKLIYDNGNVRELTEQELVSFANDEVQPSVEQQLADLADLVAVLTEVILND